MTMTSGLLAVQTALDTTAHIFRATAARATEQLSMWRGRYFVCAQFTF